LLYSLEILTPFVLCLKFLTQILTPFVLEFSLDL